MLAIQNNQGSILI